MTETMRWELVSPQGTSRIETSKISPRPKDLRGKTVVLRWNGKHNGDVFLSRIGALLAAQVEDVKIVKAWELEPFTNQTSQSMRASNEIVRKLALLKPDVVIGAHGD